MSEGRRGGAQRPGFGDNRETPGQSDKTYQSDQPRAAGKNHRGPKPAEHRANDKNSASNGDTAPGFIPRTRNSRGTYAALDLGTNNCRLLIASTRGRDFRVVDAFSRIVRLGEGVSRTGALSEGAMLRTIEALRICSRKMARRNVKRYRCIATQACRSASNGEAFLARVKEETGIEFEVISPQEEAHLAVAGCTDLIDPAARAALIFDIGGGSTEVSFLRRPSPDDRGQAKPVEIAEWFSMPNGVVSLSERWDGRDITRETYEKIVTAVMEDIRKANISPDFEEIFRLGQGHLLGTSGTATSLAGVHLELTRYRRDAVDGLWLAVSDAREISERLRAMSFDERGAEPCIGMERADLVVCGCAILEALLRIWPANRIRVADRGLREGILTGLIEEDLRKRRRRKRLSKRRRKRGKSV